ncbi:outer membrane lipoprotein-sorting protein [Bacterioplanes sanyensis]|nr:outer membrane lipoprotein-sorting protein [Bacterioplanes sanyensis]
MSLIKLGSATLLLLLTTILAAAAEPDANELLQRFDQLRGYGDQGFSFVIENSSHQPEKAPHTNRLKVRVLSDLSLVSFLSPEREKGRAMLKDGKNMWLYIPGTRKVIRVTPAQRLIGQASNGDVMGTTLSGQYQVAAKQAVQWQQQSSWQLSLQPLQEGATYGRIELWLSQQSPAMPQQAEFYSRSGKLLKTAIYEEVSEFNGHEKLARIKLVDAVRPQHYTIMNFSEYQPEDLDAAIFNKDALQYLDF